MYPTLMLAAVITFVAGGVHSWLGERDLIAPLLAVDPPPRPLTREELGRQELRFGWHLTTIAWWGLAAVLAGLALTPLDSQGRFVVASVGLTFLVSGLVVLVASRGRHLAWPLFLVVAGLALVPVV